MNSLVDRIWNLVVRIDELNEHRLYLAWKCWREGHEWDSEIDVCDHCTRIVCGRCSKYAGTVKGQE